MNEQRSYGMMNPSASRLKRKDRESIFPAKRSPLAPAPAPPSPPSRRATAAITTLKGMEVTSSNKLLAGYLAHEFLTKGTVLGQKFDNAVKNQNQNLKPSVIEVETEKWRKGKESYKEITSLMMMKSDGGGIHIPGIVNPTQLDRWIQM